MTELSDPIRIAVPNKGTLADPAAQMLSEAGYRRRRDSKELVLVDEDNHAELFFLRPRDIAVYVGSGRLDVGITGLDLLLDSDSPAAPLVELGFGRSTFRFAGPAGRFAAVADLAGGRVATAYPGVVRRHLSDRGIQAEIIRLDGAVETAVRLGVADAVADVVETGTTLRNNGLEVFGEPLLASQAVLIGRADDARVDQLVRRLQGVIIARQWVLMDYDIPTGLLDRAVAITPGFESPTVSQLHDPAWSAVRAMVRRPDTNRVMDELWDVGARAIFVTRIDACRL